MADMSLDDFYEDFRQEVILNATREDAHVPFAEAFIGVMIENLSAASVFDDAEIAPYKAHGVEVSGFALSDDFEDLVILVSIYKQSDSVETTTTANIDAAVNRAMGFLSKVQVELLRTVEESSPAFSMILAIKEAIPEIRKVKIVVITDGVAVIRTREPLKWLKRDVIVDVWDIRRLYQLALSGKPQESIDIDFTEQFGGALPCLVANDESDYRAILAIVPGGVLADIYEEFGARLLERNVRAFLQARGRVNGGIRKTILIEPDRFLAYNNGISATATECELVQLPSGGMGIARIKDLQIVNGGQTTASIHHLAKRDRERAKVDITKIFVQAKFTVVNEDQLDEIVPLISRYANSQNRINDADFEANSPFHVALETLSRRIWAPAKLGEPRMTHWFYERARGQYTDATNREVTVARKRDFKLLNPPAQKFTKTDLARFMNCWDQLPHIASMGAEKSFRYFTTERLKDQNNDLTHDDFKEIIAKAILYRQAEKIVTRRNYGGYRANIVAYTIALISHLTDKQIDFESIWLQQGLSDELESVIDQLSSMVRNVILDAPGSGNVTEWAKKAGCWEAVKALKKQLPPIDLSRPKRASARLDVTTEEIEEIIIATLDKARMPMDRATIITISKITIPQWKKASTNLIEAGVLQVDDKGANALYTLAE